LEKEYFTTAHGERWRASSGSGLHGPAIYRIVGFYWDQIDEREAVQWELIERVGHWKQGRNILKSLERQPTHVDPIGYVRRAAARKRGENAPEPELSEADTAGFRRFLNNKPPHW
jgi:hypothetical protein|tara:strand:- start:4635 stop:4979 length:345 start_codon:yes stop_codon:yes gene_type:complete